MEDPQPSMQSRLNDVMDRLESITNPAGRTELRLQEASLRIRIIDEDISSCKDNISSCNDAKKEELLLQRLVALENQKVALENQKVELHKEKNVLIAGMPFPLPLVNHHSFTQLGDANDGNNANDNNEDAQSTTSMSDPLGTPQRVEVTNLPSYNRRHPQDVTLRNAYLLVRTDDANPLKVEIQNPSLVVRSDDANPLKIQERRTCGVFPDNPVQVGVLAGTVVGVILMIVGFIFMANHS